MDLQVTKPEPDDRDAVAVQLTAAQKDELATMAATKAVELMTANAYQAVGKGFVNWVVRVSCALAIAGYFYLQARGSLPGSKP